MPDKRVVLQIERLHFEIKLAEARPILQETLGWVFQTIIPLNVRLWEIERAEVDAGGKVSLKIPHRRDLHIPLDHDDGQRLLDKLTELTPVEKARELERVRSYEMVEKARDIERTDSLQIPRKRA